MGDVLSFFVIYVSAGNLTLLFRPGSGRCPLSPGVLMLTGFGVSAGY